LQFESGKFNVFFEQEYFEKKKIVTQVAVNMPINLVIKGLEDNLKSQDTKVNLFLYKDKNRIFNKNSQQTIGDLSLRSGSKLYVIAKPDKKGTTFLKTRIKCCNIIESIIQAEKNTNFLELSTKITQQKKCCEEKQMSLIINDFVFEEGDKVVVSSRYTCYAVFKTSDLFSLQQVLHKHNKDLESKDFPVPWKLKKNGLNLRSFCYNSICAAYKQEICISKSFEILDMEEEINRQHSCPFCSEVLDIAFFNNINSNI
jgi:hypothetical protein